MTNTVLFLEILKGEPVPPSRITYMLKTPHTSLTLFTSHSVAKCICPINDYNYFEYR